MVDVRDIARAHVRAAERPQAKGRYLCTYEKKITGKQLQKALEQRFPEYSFNEMEDGESTLFADTSKVHMLNQSHATFTSSPCYLYQGLPSLFSHEMR